MKLMTVPHRYQMRGVRKIEGFKGRALIGDEMGLGKTIQALLFLLRNKKIAFPAIAVTPASLKWNWEREAANHICLDSVILEGRSVDDLPVPKKPVLWIINYDILWNWMEFLKSLKAQTLILDECHYLISRTTKRTKAAKELSMGIPHILALSGTPLTNKPSDLWPTLNIVRPDKYNSFFSFAKRYCDPRRKPWGWEYKGATNIPELHAKLKKTCMIRRRTADVLEDLPPKSRFVIPIHLSKKNRLEYDKACNSFIRWLHTNFGAAKATAAQRAERLVKMNYLKRLVALLKLDQIFDWVDSFLQESDEPIILFGIHKVVMTMIEARYGKKAVRIDGSVVGQDRQKAFDVFNNDQSKMICVANIDAAGTGWSCTRTSKMAFVEFAWTPGKHLQAESRIHGLKRGIDGKISSFYYLSVPGTIEDMICEAVQKKQINIEETLDGKVNEGLNIYDMITAKLLETGRTD